MTASEDNTAKLWQVLDSQAALVATAKTYLARERLSCQERDEAYFLDVIERCAFVADETIQGDYQGEFVNEKAHGQGSSQGLHHYRGGFKQGMKHGQGIYTWADGTHYAGEFVDDKARGIGGLKRRADGGYWEAREIHRYVPEIAIALLQTQLNIIPQHAPSLALLRELQSE